MNGTGWTALKSPLNGKTNHQLQQALRKCMKIDLHRASFHFNDPRQTLRMAVLYIEEWNKYKQADRFTYLR